MKISGQRRKWAFSCAVQCRRKNEIEGGQRVIRRRMFVSFMIFFSCDVSRSFSPT